MLRRFAQQNGLAFDLLKDKGNGLHYTVRVGDRITSVQSDEFNPFLVKIILDRLAIDPEKYLS